MLVLIVISFLVAALTVLGFMRRARRHARRYGKDMPQRFHAGHVPRLGGAGIFLGTGVAWLAAGVIGHHQCALAAQGLRAHPPVHGTRHARRHHRRPDAARVGALSPGPDHRLGPAGVRRARPEPGAHRRATGRRLVARLPYAGLLFAAVAIGGLPHAFNIIDGYNGLAGTVAVLVCLAIAHVALQLGDRQLAAMVISLVGATVGFLVWNYPRGKIFAGDGGAYVWGMVIALACVTLVQRHPIVSPWFPMLLLIYPVWETLFSVYRKLARGQSPGMADALHFHQLIFRRIVRVVFARRRGAPTAGAQQPHLALPVGLCRAVGGAGGAVLERTYVLMVFTLLFVATYVLAYLMIVRFKVPRWLRELTG